MTALAANKVRRRRGTGNMRVGSATAIDSEEYYEGALLCFTASASTVQPGADTSGQRVAGVCKARYTTGTSTTQVIEYEWGHEEWFPVAASSIAAGDEGNDAVVLDDATLSEAADTTNDVRAGRITELETIDGVAGAWIQVGVFGPAAA